MDSMEESINLFYENIWALIVITWPVRLHKARKQDTTIILNNRCGVATPTSISVASEAVVKT